jgi:hypothetical protein
MSIPIVVSQHYVEVGVVERSKRAGYDVRDITGSKQ